MKMTKINKVSRDPRARPSRFSSGEAALPAGSLDGARESRRKFLARLGSAAALVAGADLLTENPAAQAQVAGTRRRFSPLRRDELRRRRLQAYQLRVRRARAWFKAPFELPVANGDEHLYPNKIGSYSKGLPHDSLGEVDANAYETFVHACNSGLPEDFDAIPLGSAEGQPLRNPQAGLAFTVEGPDSHQILVPPAPPFASAQLAGEMVEAYWMSLARDIPFSDYATHPTRLDACAELSALSDFLGPRSGGTVTPGTIFRAPYAGATVGPYVSQFLLLPFAFGAQPVDQRIRTFEADADFLTVYSDWLDRQNGAPYAARPYDPILRYIRTGRDLAAWVDADPPAQAGIHALLILLGLGCPLDPANPYLGDIVNQDGFTTFGPVDLFDMTERAPGPAHRAVWYQKWRVHRFLRPEEYAGRVHNHLTGAASYPLHPDVSDSDVVQRVFSSFGSYLLPQAYPDGCPLHPAYPSGHSTGIGSTVTMLKALFDENFPIPNPVEPAPDGLSLQPYSGPPLTVGGELNKLAFNIGMGRVFAGIHWRSNVIWGNWLGQKISLGILKDEKGCYNEPFNGYTLTTFEGSTVTI